MFVATSFTRSMPEKLISTLLPTTAALSVLMPGCWECNEICRSEGGEWTDKALESVQVMVLYSDRCDRAKAIWLGGRAP